RCQAPAAFGVLPDGVSQPVKRAGEPVHVATRPLGGCVSGDASPRMVEGWRYGTAAQVHPTEVPEVAKGLKMCDALGCSRVDHYAGIDDEQETRAAREVPMLEEDSIGARVAAARKFRGFTQRRLADLAHVSYSLLTKVESGHVPATPAFLAAVA